MTDSSIDFLLTKQGHFTEYFGIDCFHEMFIFFLTADDFTQ